MPDDAYSFVKHRERSTKQAQGNLILGSPNLRGGYELDVQRCKAIIICIYVCTYITL